MAVELFGVRKSLPFQETTDVTAFSKLPNELLAIIASKLQNQDLKAFALSDKVCCRPAFKERAFRVLTAAQTQLRQLSNLAYQFDKEDQSPIGTYKKFLICLDRHQRILGQQLLPISEAALQSLNQSLIALVTRQLAEEVIILQKTILNDAQDASCTWDDMELCLQRSVKGLQEKLVVRAIIEIISASQDPNLLRGWAVVYAAEHGHLEILRTLLAHGVVDPIYKECILNCAVRNGNADIVQLLLLEGPISQESRERVIKDAIIKGHMSIVELLQSHLERACLIL